MAEVTFDRGLSHIEGAAARSMNCAKIWGIEGPQGAVPICCARNRYVTVYAWLHYRVTSIEIGSGARSLNVPWQAWLTRCMLVIPWSQLDIDGSAGNLASRLGIARILACLFSDNAGLPTS